MAGNPMPAIPDMGAVRGVIAMNRRVVELFAAVAVGLIFTMLLVESFHYRGQSSYMPIATTGLAVILCAGWAVQSARLLVTGRGDRYDATPADFGRFALVVGVGILYVLGVTFVGFFTSTIIMVPGLAFALGYRSLKVAIVATVGFIVVLYGVFELLLSIPLPQEALFGMTGL